MEILIRSGQGKLTFGNDVQFSYQGKQLYDTKNTDYYIYIRREIISSILIFQTMYFVSV